MVRKYRNNSNSKFIYLWFDSMHQKGTYSAFFNFMELALKRTVNRGYFGRGGYFGRILLKCFQMH